MNNKIISTIALTTFSLSSLTLCMEQYSPRTLCLKQYQEKLTTINKEDEIKLEQYKNKTMDNDLTQEKIIIRKKLGHYKHDLLGEKNKILNDIKKHNNISDDVWNACFELIRDIQDYNKNNQALPLSSDHDTAINQNLLCFMRQRLEKNGIKPQHVSISSKKNVSPVAYHLEQEPYTPTEIIIDWDIVSQLPELDQMALCIRATEEAIQFSRLTPHIIAFVTKQKSIINSPQFIALEQLCVKKLPVLLPCFTNAFVAHCMMNFVFNYYQQELTEQDYKFLSKVNRCWNELEWIKQLEHIPSSVRVLL